MKKIIGSMLVGISALTFAVGPTHANLVVNGSFEETGAKSGSWFLLTPDEVPGWSSNDPMEFWLDHGIDSFEGDKHLELNAHSGSRPYSIWQDFDTEIGKWYQVSFAAAARGSGSEKFRVEIIGRPFEPAAITDGLIQQTSDGAGGAGLISQPALSEVVDSLSQREWKTFSFDFTAVARSSRLRFTSIVPTGTMGNLLDDVSVQSVPAPSTLAIFALGILGLASRCRRQTRSAFAQNSR